jgi:hypothetical protein
LQDHDGFFEELRAEGHSLGLKQGIEQGIEKGLIAAFVARFGPMPTDLRALVHKIQDKRLLRECFGFIGAASAEEAFAGLRAQLKATSPRSSGCRSRRG